MFWRFGFHNGSAIDSLLDKEDVALEAILDEDDLLQECKAQNNRLISYFERVDVLQKLLGYVTGQVESEEKGRFKYPYIATEVLCSDIWSIVDTCVREQQQLLVPFWETVLERSADDMKTQMTMATHFVKINSTFLSKKPTEMLAFMQSQPNLVERIVQHIETPSFVDLLSRIIQLDESLSNCNVLDWLSSEGFMGRLIALLSPNHTPSVHSVVTDLIKNIISMATPSPGAGITEGLQNGLASNIFARQLALKENIQKLSEYMLINFSPESCADSDEQDAISEDGTLTIPTFESLCSSVVQSIVIVIELIRKNNSDYFEPYLFHTLRNRLIHVQQQSHLAGEDVRASLEQVMGEMVNRMGVVHLGPVLDVLSSQLSMFQKYLEHPRSLEGPLDTTLGTMIPFTLERYRIVELYAELLHCSNMSLLNRTPAFAHMYDVNGKLQGGLSGLEELAQVIALNSSNEDSDAMDDAGDEIEPALELPVRNNTSDDSPSLDSDDDMSSDNEPGSSDDDAMEEIAMYDEPQLQLSPIPISKALPTPISTDVSPESSLTPPSQEGTPTNGNGSNPPSPSPISEVSRFASRSPTGRGSRRSSRSRRRATAEIPKEIIVPIGDVLKRRFLDEKVLITMIDLFFQFPWNNFLHSAVYDIIHQVMTGSVDAGLNRELIVSLFRDAKILHRIVEGQRQNDEACSKPKGVRLGYMGHLMLISEDIITAMARFPPDLRLDIIHYAPEPEWDQYVTGKYNQTKQEDSRLLGGGKPVVKSGFTKSVTQWKVDEDELANDTKTPSGSSSTTAASIKGEFKRTSSQSNSVTQTADFGPPPMDEDDDEDNVSNGRPPHFARYLSQEMNTDQFGDEDDEDEGWLSQSTFGLSTTTASSRTFGNRQPLGSGGFEDAFDPTGTTSIAMSEDPFSPHDDDGFGPFSDSAASNPSTGFNFSSASFSDDDGSFESFGEFGDFQSADDGDSTPPTSGSWTFASAGGSSAGIDEFGMPNGTSSSGTSESPAKEPDSDPMTGIATETNGAGSNGARVSK